MFDRLSRGPASVSELAEPIALALPSAVKHLRVLEEGGLVLSHKTGRVRTYRIDPGALSAIELWTSERQAAYRAAFDRLAAAMAELPEEAS